MNTWYSPISFGKQADSTLRSLHLRLRDFRGNDPAYRNISDEGRNGEWIMGFSIPPFQRDHVWTQEQEIAFVNSARRRLHLGTYTFNITAGMKEARRVDENGREYYFADLWLLDGMQRLTALQRFFDNEFPVAGSYWSDVSEENRRFFLSDVHFASYETNLVDEAVMREMYDAMNFGGTAHREEERAVSRHSTIASP
ncbi:DUF262 domain-containing protein [Agrobacterium salinitolerans]|nr:DUF262 domain-containing protein [Agrobacterium salinitolerans]